jgi:ATPase subunit of ABC transporter with duplicated ATPase domains
MEVILGLLVIGGIIWLIYRYQEKQGELARKAAREKEEAERQRNEDCQEVVRYFANYHGFIARSVVSREELETAIDSGASANQLANLIADRIEQVEGLHLGYQTVGGCRFPVILPLEYRDKHIYVIGKSGYGKTNFLRHLIQQDLQNGEGTGVLAPNTKCYLMSCYPSFRKSGLMM